MTGDQQRNKSLTTSGRSIGQHREMKAAEEEEGHDTHGRAVELLSLYYIISDKACVLVQ